MHYSSTIENIPSGAPGLAHKARRIRELVERAKRDPNFRAQTAALLRGIQEKDHGGEINTLINFVRDRVRYMRDPWSPGGLELFTKPQTLLRDALKGQASGDCDDHVILASSLLETAGYETNFAVGADGPEDYRHIWLEVLHPQTGWITADLTTKEQEIGWDPGPAYHHVETHTGRGEDEMTLGHHAPRALPPSFHNVYREPGIYAGSTPSDFFRAVAMRGELPQGNAYALLGEGHQLDGFFSKIAEWGKDALQTYGPIAAGVGATIIGGPAAGATVYGVTTALTAEEEQQLAVPMAAPTQTQQIVPESLVSGFARVFEQAGAPVTEADIRRVVERDATIVSAPAYVAAQTPMATLPASTPTESIDDLLGPPPPPRAAGGFNPMWVVGGLSLLLLLRKK